MRKPRGENREKEKSNDHDCAGTIACSRELENQDIPCYWYTTKKFVARTGGRTEQI